MKEKFCAYCQKYRKDDGRFKLIRHPTSVGRGRNPTPRYQCGYCQDHKAGRKAGNPSDKELNQ